MAHFGKSVPDDSLPVWTNHWALLLLSILAQWACKFIQLKVSSCECFEHGWHYRTISSWLCSLKYIVPFRAPKYPFDILRQKEIENIELNRPPSQKQSVWNVYCPKERCGLGERDKRPHLLLKMFLNDQQHTPAMAECVKQYWRDTSEHIFWIKPATKSLLNWSAYGRALSFNWERERELYWYTICFENRSKLQRATWGTRDLSKLVRVCLQGSIPSGIVGLYIISEQLSDERRNCDIIKTPGLCLPARHRLWLWHVKESNSRGLLCFVVLGPP